MNDLEKDCAKWSWDEEEMDSQKSSPSNVTLNKIIEIQLSHLCALKLTSKTLAFLFKE
jgi:hypothetical protein